MPDQPLPPQPANPTLNPDVSTQQPIPQTPSATTQTTPPAQMTQSNFGDPLLTDKTMPEDLDSRWNSLKCMVCGYVYEGEKSVIQCPRCGNSDPDKFD